MRIVFLTAAILAALTLAACGDDDDEGVTGDDATNSAATSAPAAGGQNIELVAADFQFAPTTLNLAAGETYSITLINTGQARHGFTVDDIDVSEEVNANSETTFDFTAPAANAEFFCQFHPDTMVGSIAIGGSVGGTTSSPVVTFPLTTEDADDDDNGGPGSGDDDDGGDIDGGGYGY